MTPSGVLQDLPFGGSAVSLTAWDDFVADNRSGHVFQTTQWAAYRRRIGWHPIPIALSNHGSVLATCLVLHRSIANLPFGGILYAARGPVLDYDSPDAPHLLSAILDRLTELARRRFAVVRISPDVERSTTWVGDLLQKAGFRRAKRSLGHTATIRLDLTQPLDRIVAGMSKSRRPDISRYERQKADWSFHGDVSLESLELLYSMYSQTMIDAGKAPKSFSDLRLMHETLAPYGCSIIFIVRYRDRPVAGVDLVPTKKHLWGIAASMAKGSEAVRGASVALYWEMIQWAKRRGYTTFDLQGIPDPPDPHDALYGIYQFKRRWGGKEIRLIGEYDYTPYPFLDRILEWRLGRETS